MYDPNDASDCEKEQVIENVGSLPDLKLVIPPESSVSEVIYWPYGKENRCNWMPTVLQVFDTQLGIWKTL